MKNFETEIVRQNNLQFDDQPVKLKKKTERPKS